MTIMQELIILKLLQAETDFPLEVHNHLCKTNSKHTGYHYWSQAATLPNQILRNIN